MELYYVTKDGRIIGAFHTREEAIELIRMKQMRESNPILKPSFSIIKGTEEFIPYAK